MLRGMWRPGWEGSLERIDTYVRMAEPLGSPPETITTLSTSFTPVQKVKSKYLRKSHRVMDIKVPTTVVADTAPALSIWECIPSVWTWK